MVLVSLKVFPNLNGSMILCFCYSFTSALHLSLASVKETSRTYNPITSRQGSCLKHVIKTDLHCCCSESIAFWDLRNKTRKHNMTQKERTVTPVLILILCFSDHEKESSLNTKIFLFCISFTFLNEKHFHLCTNMCWNDLGQILY